MRCVGGGGVVDSSVGACGGGAAGEVGGTISRQEERRGAVQTMGWEWSVVTHPFRGVNLGVALGQQDFRLTHSCIPLGPAAWHPV